MIRSGNSLVQLVMKAIGSREDSLESIETMGGFLESYEKTENMEEIQRECLEVFSAYRIISLSVVESIVKWRQSFERPVAFYYQD